MRIPQIFSIVFLLCFSQMLPAQEAVANNMVRFKTGSPNAPFSIIDTNNELHLFFVSKKAITQLVYDVDYKLKSTKTYTSPPSPFKDLIGYSLGTQNQINLYFSNKKTKRFYLKTIQSGSVIAEKDFDFKIKNEAFVQAINHENFFYILTAVYTSNELKLYRFEGEKKEVLSFQFSRKQFYSSHNVPTRMSDVFANSEIPIILDEEPSAIDIATNAVKIYPKKNTLFISIDTRRGVSRFITLNLNDGSSKIVDYKVGKDVFNKLGGVRSNSFLYKGNLYQIMASREQLLFRVKNFPKGDIIKEFAIEKEAENIPFKNSPIYQDGSTYSSGIRELDKTKQFLRKIAKSSIGVFAYEKDNLLQLQIGGVKALPTGGGAPAFGAFGGIPIAGGGAFTVAVNPTFYAYNSYSRTRSVYIKCLFDVNTIEHQPGPTENNVFDAIADFSDNLQRIGLETVFRKGDHFIYGYFNRKETRYNLVKFTP